MAERTIRQIIEGQELLTAPSSTTVAEGRAPDEAAQRRRDDGR